MHSTTGLLCILSILSTLSIAQTPSLSDLAALTSGWESTQHASNDFSFYDVPSNFSADLEPGSVLKLEVATDLTNYTVPSSLTMSRMIYTTVDVHDNVIAASAYVLWPYRVLSEDDTKGYPVVAWAHGTTGLFKPCAPSNYRSLQYHFMVPYLLAQQGYVVVATDYAGLGVNSLPDGTSIHHPWATGPAQANDIAHAVTAARNAFPDYLTADGPFVTLGHSEGGRAAWAFAERQASDPIPGYRGTVAFAPAADAIAQVEQALQNPDRYWTYNALGLQPMLNDAVTAVYPDYNWAGLTNVSSHIFHDFYETSQGCLPTQSALFGGVPLDQLARPGWTDDALVRQWQNLTRVGRKPFAGPLFVIHGAVDSIIPYNDSISSAVLSTVEDTCTMLHESDSPESLEFEAYEYMDHFPVIQASEGRWLSWVREQLSDQAPQVPAGCTINTIHGFRTESTYQATVPNFLVEWVNETLVWQYTL